VTFDRYDAYSIVVPSDPRLAGGGGYTLSGLYDPKAQFGTANYVTLEDEAHRRTVRWQGVDVNFTARMKNGLVIRGGWVQASTLTDICNTIVDNPEGLRTCRSTTPLAINGKGAVAYTTPKLFGKPALEGFVVSTVINARPLNTKVANYLVPNSVVQTALGRVPTGATVTNGVAQGTVTKNILTTDELMYPTFLDTQWDADLRVSRVVRLAGVRLDLGVDLFNVLNLSSVTSRDTTFTPTGVLANNWLRAQSVESARFAKFYVQFDF
jgi:hypothetical protein